MNCQACGSNNKVEIMNLCSNMQIIGKSFPKIQSRLVKCADCGFVYVDSGAAKENYFSYYNSDNCIPIHYNELYSNSEITNYFNIVLNNIKKYINYNSRILDVGGGTGEFAHFLKSKGYENVTVMDISDACINECEKSGVATINSDSYKLIPGEKGKYDLIIYLHSIEHFYDMRQSISTAEQMLSDEGVIYIVSAD